MARARAGEYAERVAAQVETLTVTLGTVVAELRTLGDPDAAAVQIDAVTAEAEQRVAEAMAWAARAEQDRRAAEQQRTDADAAAEEATAAVDALTGRLEAATAARAAGWPRTTLERMGAVGGDGQVERGALCIAV